MVESMWIAISMYSKLPVPFVEWKKENLRFVLCFFPLIGVFIGIAELIWWYLAKYLGIGAFLMGCIGAAIPIIITGGIHMDGFMDTEDALNSYGSKEKKLEILKDAHLGAFAVIRFGVYILLYAGLYSELHKKEGIYLVAIGYLLSRAWSAIGFVTLKTAKETGMLYEFATAADKKVVLASNGCLIGLLSIIGIYLSRIAGVIIMIGLGLVFWGYKKRSYKEFGGITGDLAGHFLQKGELFILLVAIIYFYCTTR